MHDAWILSLYREFCIIYRDQTPSVDNERFEVFAKPLKKESGLVKKTPFGRGEYGFDLAVVRLRDVKAPYHHENGKNTNVPVVVSYLWQVESEIRNSATQISEDLGKLIGGAASYKLFIAPKSNQKDRGDAWLAFLEKLTRSVSGVIYVVLVDSYASKAGAKKWVDGRPDYMIFQRRQGDETLLKIHGK